MRAILGVFACLASTMLFAAEHAKTILDCSGSMWGEIHGRTKIDIAREAIGKVVGRRDSNTQLGLMAYGHWRKGDCNDIELLIPAGPLNRAAVVSADSAAFCSFTEPQLCKKAAGSISSRKITRPRTDLAIGVIALTCGLYLLLTTYIYIKADDIHPYRWAWLPVLNAVSLTHLIHPRPQARDR